MAYATPISRNPTHSRVRTLAADLRHLLPQGRLLPERNWRPRHGVIVTLLVLHAVGLPLFGWIEGYGLRNSLVESSILVVAAGLAMLPFLGRQLRASIASLGLLTASGVFVHLWGGATEATFHFFVVVAVLTLYQDWVPFLIAIVYVFFHFGLIGSLYPTYVYDNPRAWAAPWYWAGVYAAFVTAMSVANMVSWRTNEKLLRDTLTGLPSRLVFLDRLTLALVTASKKRRTFTVLFFDLDRFKNINDRLGHAAGDALLIETARRVERTLRAEQTLARLGGDEFGVLCPDIHSPREARTLARRISAAVARPVTVENEKIVTTASVGITMTDRLTHPETLLKEADQAMYRAKAKGGGEVVLFGKESRARPAA